MTIHKTVMNDQGITFFTMDDPNDKTLSNDKINLLLTSDELNTPIDDDVPRIIFPSKDEILHLKNNLGNSSSLVKVLHLIKKDLEFCVLTQKL